jgi:N-acetylneuraminic acid mutarotase
MSIFFMYATPRAKYFLPRFFACLLVIIAVAYLPALTLAADSGWSVAGELGVTASPPNATLLPSGEVLLTSGYGADVDSYGNGPYYQASIYEPATTTWSNAANLLVARYRNAVTLLVSGKVLMTGGAGQAYSLPPGGDLEVGWRPSLNSSDIYDPATDAWSKAADLGTARYYHTATLLTSGKVLVVGGWSSSGRSTDTELYDPTTDTWIYVASLSHPRYGHTATLLRSGQVLIVGGSNGGGEPISAELYDPVTDSWSTAGSVSEYYLIGHSATLLTSGKVLVTGGAYLNLSSTELYDPDTNSWSPAASMHTPRARHSATLLANGKVLVAGGSGTNHSSIHYGATPTDAAELYDPASDSWSSIDGLAQPRFMHTAIRLESGQVLIAGGRGDNDSIPLKAAELYTPQVIVADAATPLPTLSSSWLLLLAATLIATTRTASLPLRYRRK